MLIDGRHLRFGGKERVGVDLLSYFAANHLNIILTNELKCSNKCSNIYI